MWDATFRGTGAWSATARTRDVRGTGAWGRDRTDVQTHETQPCGRADA